MILGTVVRGPVEESFGSSLFSLSSRDFPWLSIRGRIASPYPPGDKLRRPRGSSCRRAMGWIEKPGTSSWWAEQVRMDYQLSLE